MKKALIAIFCALILSVTAVFASACSFFRGNEGGRQIENIRSYHSDEDGGTYIVIEYYGDEYADSLFFIPDAEPGKEGTGISRITHSLNDDGTTTITIEYSDPSRYPAEFTIPNGLYISNMNTDIDPQTGERRLIIEFSNPEIMPPLVISIPTGKDGKDGDKIQDIFTSLDEEGNIVVHVVVSRYDEETGEWVEEETIFIVPRGEKGKGISSISVNYQTYSDPNYFYLDIIYEDGSFETIQIPRANSWYVGEDMPGAAQYNIGDFYFDKKNQIIYYKTTSGWEVLVDFGGYSQEKHAVYFYIDDVCVRTEYITHGYNFASTPEAKLDIPQREGYRFMGWFTEAGNPDDPDSFNPNSGQFTDLTPVMANITLYARWQKI